MKNILILMTCVLLYSCGGSGNSDEEVKPDYTTVKQQLPLKLTTWSEYINSKEFTSAKSMTVNNSDFWKRTSDAEANIANDKQTKYQFISKTLNADKFYPEQGSAELSGIVRITTASLKIVEERDYTATLYCSTSPEQISNWKLNSLQLK
jgi:uncharacterized membrane protein YwaF